MSKIKNGGLDQYGAEPFKQQQFGTAGIERVDVNYSLCLTWNLTDCYTDDEVTLRPVPLLSLLPINLNNYYRYHGSLTTPPCSEIVSWTVFHDLVDISAKQVTHSYMYIHRVGQKTDCFLKVRNSHICCHRITLYIPNCSAFYPE